MVDSIKNSFILQNERLSPFMRVLVKVPFIKFFVSLYYGLYDFFTYTLNVLETPERKTFKEDIIIYKNYSKLKFKQKLQNFFYSKSFLLIDVFYVFVFSFKYSIFTTFDLKQRISYTLDRTNQGFYFEYVGNVNQTAYYWKNLFAVAWVFIWKAVRVWVLALAGFFFVGYYLSVIRVLPFNKIIFEWLSLGMFSYWLLSGFVFFFKKYQFGKYTSVIQRFWRRSYILFWILEGVLVIIFLYLTINASTEPFYMYDQSQIFKTHLFSWRFFLLKLLPLTFLIVIGYIYLISVKWTLFSKNILFLLILTSVLMYVVWVEFYQFFHICNFYGNLFWVYDVEDRTWSLETEPRRTRIVNHYISLVMILKFWHIVLIFVFWVFSLLRWAEIKRVRYPLLSANLQNFIILYLFAWISMYPWFKFYYRKLLDLPYYWFYTNNHLYGFRVIWNDIKLIGYGILKSFKVFSTEFYFTKSSFYYWSVFNSDFGFNGFKKHFIKDQILKTLMYC